MTGWGQGMAIAKSLHSRDSGTGHVVRRSGAPDEISYDGLGRSSVPCACVLLAVAWVPRTVCMGPHPEFPPRRYSPPGPPID